MPAFSIPAQFHQWVPVLFFLRKSYWFQFSGFMLAGRRFISSVVTVPVTKPVTSQASIRIAM